ncbi:MAG: glycosyltransferase [Flavobacteriaceae bacterium]|nr:glycosyltransferase [Flavobacteriaceae bacterium]
MANKKTKILFTIPNFDTAGSGKVVYDLVKYLDKNNFEPEICCFHSRGKFFNEVEKLGVPIHIFPFTTPYHPLPTFLFRVLKIRRFFKKHQFDMIHSWHWSSDFSEPLAAKLAGIPFVYTKKAMGWGNKSWLWRSKLSSKIIAINDDMMSEFFSEMKEKTIQLPLGVDTAIFKPQAIDVTLKRELYIEAGDFVIVSVVNMVPVKGIEILLNAVRLLKDSRLKVFLIGNDKSEYVDYLKEEYSEQQFVFLGKKLDVKPYLALADVFVIPTKDEGRREGMPIAPLEAMAMSIPVIGSKISGIKDVLKDYPELLFTPSDTEDLKLKIVAVKNLSSQNKINLKEKIRATVIENFSLEGFIKERENIYKTMTK